MRLLRLLLLALTAAALAGCGTPPSMAVARVRAATDTHGLTVAEAIKRTDHTVQHLNSEKSIVYSQTFGGGGAGLGLLLGPIGVAANISMIESATKADAAKLLGKVKVDPVALFQEAAAAEQLALQPAGTTPTVRLTPYLLIIKVNETTLNPGAAVFAEAAGTDGKPWVTKYVLQLPGSYSVDSLAALDDAQAGALRDDIRASYRRLVAFYNRDNAEASTREQKVIFKSAFVNPRFDFDMAGSLIEQSGSTVWLRTYSGVFALQSSSVTYTVQK
jgi:hypothetical protein